MAKKWRVEDSQGEDEKFIDRELWRQRVMDVSETAWCFGDLPDNHWSQLGLSEARKAMSMLRHLLDSRDIGLTAAVYPWPSNIIGDDSSLRCRTAWDSWARSENVDLINLFEDFDGGDPWKTVETYFIPYDVHWKAAGHGRVAEAVAGRFEATDLMP